jgi:hypothetical protein
MFQLRLYGKAQCFICQPAGHTVGVLPALFSALSVLYQCFYQCFIVCQPAGHTVGVFDPQQGAQREPHTSQTQYVTSHITSGHKNGTHHHQGTETTHAITRARK